MKGLALTLLCIVAAVQGRNTGVQTFRWQPAELGQNSWVVHLRVAVATSGLLNSCVGSLIDSRWVLTAASCLTDARFIWIRYGLVDVISPELVTESSAVRIDPTNVVGLVSINRVVHSTPNIGSIPIADREFPVDASYCGFGETDTGAPGEQLSCFVSSIPSESATLPASRFDIGSPLVNNARQFGILVDWSDDSARFVKTVDYSDWIQGETGIDNLFEYRD